MNVTKPSSNHTFEISPAPEWPTIEFETDGSGPHVWNWSIHWGTYSKSGVAHTDGNTWNASEAIQGLGGALKVQIQAGDDSSEIAVEIVGSNPTADEVNAYVRSHPGSEGFDKIIARESKYKHFTADAVPTRTFDKGYGMCQLTHPAPSFEQVWNWKRNVDGGLALFAEKHALAKHYLSQNGRHYTPQQLMYEAVCQWNGGSYHVWDEQAGAWVRTPHILCDTTTGNIGWDMTLAENQGKTESELHQRDGHSYSKPPGHGSGWKYSGVCYADKILG
jgi:hypothetical protein